jgi:hypothetical protein
MMIEMTIQLAFEFKMKRQ